MLDSLFAVKRCRGPARRARSWLTVVAVLGAIARGFAEDAPPPSAPAVACWPTPIGDVAYTPGRGLRVGDTGLTLGGYTNTNLTRDEGQPAKLALDDLSLFVIWDPTARFHLFSELEFEDLVEVQGGGHVGNPDYQFNLERLYGDYTLSDALTVRVGKFLTPVGRWNVIHAQPLVWTTSRPLVTELPFDEHTTGAMLFGSVFPGAHTVTWELYGQATNQLDPTPTADPADRAGGGRVELSGPVGESIGASVLAAERFGAWRELGGIDGAFARGRFEGMGEAVVERGERASDNLWGFYLQGVVETLPHVFVVARYEHWVPQLGARASNLAVGGLAYRPFPWLVLKTEYLAADHPVEESPPGFKASIAILF